MSSAKWRKLCLALNVLILGDAKNQCISSRDIDLVNWKNPVAALEEFMIIIYPSDLVINMLNEHKDAL